MQRCAGVTAPLQRRAGIECSLITWRWRSRPRSSRAWNELGVSIVCWRARAAWGALTELCRNHGREILRRLLCCLGVPESIAVSAAVAGRNAGGGVAPSVAPRGTSATEGDALRPRVARPRYPIHTLRSLRYVSSYSSRNRSLKVPKEEGHWGLAAIGTRLRRPAAPASDSTTASDMFKDARQMNERNAFIKLLPCNFIEFSLPLTLSIYRVWAIPTHQTTCNHLKDFLISFQFAGLLRLFEAEGKENCSVEKK